MKYLKWFFILLKAIVLRKATYTISFTKECDKLWYVDFPNWPLSHDNLQMVAGADDLLNRLNDGSNHISLYISTKKGIVTEKGMDEDDTSFDDSARHNEIG